MNTRKLTIFENMIWNTIGSFTYLLCQWLLTLIVVRGTNDMANAGNLALAISVTNIFYNLACFNVRPYLVSDLKHRYVPGEYSSFRMVTCGFSFVACICYVSFFEYSPQQFTCILLYMIFKLGEAWVDLLHGFEQRKSRMDIGGVSLFVRGLLSIISFSITLYCTGSINWSVFVMSICTIGFIVLFDCRVAVTFEKITPKFRWKTISQMLLEFLPLTVGSFMSTVSANLPKQVLEVEMGSENLGIYSTVATPSVIVQVAASYVFNPLLTKFAQLYNTGEKKEFARLVAKISAVLLGLSFVCMCGASLLGEWGLGFLYGKKIKSHAYLFMPVICYTCLNAFVWFFWNLLIVMRKTKILLWVNALGLISCMGIMKKLISVYGMNGVSYTLILYSIVVIGLMLGVLLYDLNSKGRDCQTGKEV